MSNNNNSNPTKYLYLRDPDNNDRVLTLGRRVDGDTVTLAYSLNRVVPSLEAYRHNNFVPQDVVVDRFSKKVGQTIVTGRFDSGVENTHSFQLRDGERPIEATLRELVSLRADLTDEDDRHSCFSTTALDVACRVYSKQTWG